MGWGGEESYVEERRRKEGERGKGGKDGVKHRASWLTKWQRLLHSILLLALLLVCPAQRGHMFSPSHHHREARRSFTNSATKEMKSQRPS